MPQTSPARDLKTEIQDFWNADPCGTRYLGTQQDFDSHAQARYRLEPYIHDFAGFAQATGKRVLEVGVGMGADYLEWLKSGAVATGIDLSAVSIQRARQRCQLAGYIPDLKVSDSEHLPFASETFDLVYSYGVMHHSPDTPQCIREAWRVLKPSGELRIMIYHHPSLTGFMLWLRYGLWRRISLRQAVYEKLESPGTKSYTHDQARALLDGFDRIAIRQVFSPGDLLLHEPSERFQGRFYRMIWALYPRAIVRTIGRRFGLFLLISARKPATD